MFSQHWIFVAVHQFVSFRIELLLKLLPFPRSGGPDQACCIHEALEPVHMSTWAACSALQTEVQSNVRQQKPDLDPGTPVRTPQPVFDPTQFHMIEVCARCCYSHSKLYNTVRCVCTHTPRTVHSDSSEDSKLPMTSVLQHDVAQVCLTPWQWQRKSGGTQRWLRVVVYCCVHWHIVDTSMLSGWAAGT